jgi:hypothetical protein
VNGARACHKLDCVSVFLFRLHYILHRLSDVQRRPYRNRKTNAPDRSCPRVLHRPLRYAGALRNGRCGKLYSHRVRQVKRALRSGDIGNRLR